MGSYNVSSVKRNRKFDKSDTYEQSLRCLCAISTLGGSREISICIPYAYHMHIRLFVCFAFYAVGISDRYAEVAEGWHYCSKTRAQESR